MSDPLSTNYKQLSAANANQSYVLTKCRWCSESLHTHVVVVVCQTVERLN